VTVVYDVSSGMTLDKCVVSSSSRSYRTWTLVVRSSQTRVF